MIERRWGERARRLALDGAAPRLGYWGDMTARRWTSDARPTRGLRLHPACGKKRTRPNAARWQPVSLSVPRYRPTLTRLARGGVPLRADRRERGDRRRAGLRKAWGGIPGGEFSMGVAPPPAVPTAADGCGDPLADAQPVHRVYVDGFWMDRTEVTNEEFARFARTTGYVMWPSARRRPTNFPRRHRRTWWLGPSCSIHREGRCRSTRSSAGGPTCLAPAGDIPSAREATCAGASTTRWCTSRTRTRRRMLGGPTNACPPRPSTSSPRAEASRESPTRGATSFAPTAAGWPTRSRATSRTRTPARTDGKGIAPVASYPPQRVRPARRRRQRLGVGERLVPARLLRDARGGLRRGAKPRRPTEKFSTPPSPG